MGIDADTFMGWWVEGTMMMGSFGLFGDLLVDTVEQHDNGAYGRGRIIGKFAGPTFGLVDDVITIGQGIMDSNEGSNAKEREAARRFASRIPVVGGNRAMKEDIVDFIAGKKMSRRKTFNPWLGR